MNRFFNYGQGSAADVNFFDLKLRVMEKMDGTLTILYFDRFASEWHVATRAVPEANLEIESGFYTFRTLFEKALADMGVFKDFTSFVSKLDKEITYCFELTSPFNRIVVDYYDTRLTFLAARKVSDLTELDISQLSIGIPHVRTYSLSDINDIVNWVFEQSPLEHEGVVVMDSKFHRIKVKNASYVAFNRARDVLGTSERNCLELVLARNEDDIIPVLPPEIVDRILNIKRRINVVINYYDRTFNYLKGKADLINKGDKKTFALLVKDVNGIWSAPMFTMFDGKASTMSGFIEINRKNGTWSNSFLDKLLALCEHH